jgi:DNA-binding MarR family transcriptional regulator
MENNQKNELFETVSKFRKMHSWVHSFAGLAQGEFMMMHVIDRYKKLNEDQEEPGVKISQLCSFMHMSKPGASQMLKSLENKELIERIMGKKDRRIIHVDLTEKGEALLEEAMQQSHATWNRIIEEFGEQDTKTLITLLNRIYDIMEKMNDSKADQA